MNKNLVDLKNSEILIVDDIPANLNVLRQTLEPEGYEIIAAASGEVALKIAARTQPSLILLDVVMPGLDGFETCHRLKAEKATADIPVIFITAKDETQSIVKGFEVGGVDYITKPFRHEEVRARVKTHLTIKQLRDELERSYLRLEADNTRKTEELETARVIQQGFLPASVPELPHLEIAPFQRAATEVGGDYYDFFPQADGKLLVAIGDATGHGVGASLMVSATKMALLTIDEANLDWKVCRMNAYLKQVNRSHRLNMGLTLVELQPDGKSNALLGKASGGGMPPLYLLRSSGDVEEIIIEGLPLGAMEGAKYRYTEFRLERSDQLILLSDGFPERPNDTGDLFGYPRLVTEIQNAGKSAHTASELLDALIRAVDE